MIFKFSETRNMNRYTVTTYNYMIASAVSLFFVISEGFHGLTLSAAADSFLAQFSRVISSGGSFDLPGSAGWAAVVGIPSGVL
ncbi:MAG: hypothetical protein GF388_07550, partial [Candidatus Aegiribacteria sp.]|nr:hypothetical protein [Candidatus Aegiribacteria sp.]MBD3294979.1 hypothetical protein [Candidatus Fermentibacteria bacterium]